jgi:hypothetical protein
LVTVAEVGSQNQRIHINRYLKSFDFNYVTVVDRGNEITSYPLSPQSSIAGTTPLPLETREFLRSIAPDLPGKIMFSDLMRENGKGVFYVVMSLDDAQLLIGSLDPAFIRKIQRSITFGERGHSMVVDATSRVVAHPNPQWEAISKDASKLSVVQKMIRGETG